MEDVGDFMRRYKEVFSFGEPWTHNVGIWEKLQYEGHVGIRDTGQKDFGGGWVF